MFGADGAPNEIRSAKARHKTTKIESHVSLVDIILREEAGSKQ
jgi:hypothetical protein